MGFPAHVASIINQPNLSLVSVALFFQVSISSAGYWPMQELFVHWWSDTTLQINLRLNQSIPVMTTPLISNSLLVPGISWSRSAIFAAHAACILDLACEPNGFLYFNDFHASKQYDKGMWLVMGRTKYEVHTRRKQKLIFRIIIELRNYFENTPYLNAGSIFQDWFNN